MKQVKLLYRKKKHAVYFWSECTKGSAAELIQTNKFAFDKTTAAAFAFYTKPTLFVTSLSLWLAAFVRICSLKPWSTNSREFLKRWRLETPFSSPSSGLKQSLRTECGCSPPPLPHSSSINIPLIIILKWKRILCWSANLMNYGSRLLRLIIKTYFINIQVCHASNNERFRGGYFPCAS